MCDFYFFMKKLTLNYIKKEPIIIDSKTSLLILLHGYGSNKEDLFSFASELPDNLLVISAEAPIDMGYGGYAWYNIHFNNAQSKFSDPKEVFEAMENIANFIDEIQDKYHILPEKTFLLGFSQGTILSYAVALNYPKKVQKVIALSGYINVDLLPHQISDNSHSKLDFFISHGSVDQVIPVEWAKKAPQILNNYNINNCYSEYPVGHGVSPQNFFAFKKWIEERI